MVAKNFALRAYKTIGSAGARQISRIQHHRRVPDGGERDCDALRARANIQKQASRRRSPLDASSWARSSPVLLRGGDHNGCICGEVDAFLQSQLKNTCDLYGGYQWKVTRRLACGASVRRSDTTAATPGVLHGKAGNTLSQLNSLCGGSARTGRSYETSLEDSGTAGRPWRRCRRFTTSRCH
jgi:hypothetical protein